jgi:hypothetical protein
MSPKVVTKFSLSTSKVIVSAMFLLIQNYNSS